MPFKGKLNILNGVTERYLVTASNFLKRDKLDEIAKRALQKFIDASPTEEIASHWSYEVEGKRDKFRMFFNNDLIQNDVNIAIVVDHGHATRSGSWVAGKNYLPKTTQKAYDQIIEETWEELEKYERHR